MQLNFCKRDRVIEKFIKLLAFCVLLQINTAIAQKITISQSDVTLEQAFIEIEKQTGYTFFYSNNAMQQAKRLTIVIENVPVEEVMALILKDQPFIYIISNKTLVIRSIRNDLEEMKLAKNPTHGSWSDDLLILILLISLFARFFKKPNASKPVKENNSNQSGTVSSEVQNTLKNAILGFHFWELWETISDKASD